MAETTDASEHATWPETKVPGELCSGDMLLETLVGCADVTLKA